MKPILFSLPENEPLAQSLISLLKLEKGDFEFRSFPDGESYFQVRSSVEGKVTYIFCSLNDPNSKALDLYFLASTLKDLKASKITLIAPYLSYMRQDTQFHPGEGVTSRYFAKLLSSVFDGLITIDPHLHRYSSLNEIYSIPTTVLSATPLISQWILGHVENPVLIGPDSESKQWVSEVARAANAPFVVLEKIRKGDRQVEVSIPEINQWKNHTPVIVDDIISSARTMIETVKHLNTLKLSPPVCVGVHAIFAENAYADLLAAGAGRVVTCNTIEHVSNAVDVSSLLLSTF